jgi:indole-3-glycerol phosphate synthase
MSVLDEILASKRDEVTLLHQPATRRAIEQAALAAPAPRDFAGALRRADGTLAVISELKRKSPSKGVLAPDLDPVTTAKAYEAGGAAALSVLTDRLYFDGSVDDLRDARDATSLPALRKDFTIAEIQIYEARAIGADAVLLIVAAFTDDGYLRDLHDLARDLRLAVLVETHDGRELERALAIGARIVGVNSRSLHTFAEDLGIAESLADHLPDDVIAVAESAVRSADDAQRVAAAGFDAVLVGEALVKADDPTALVHAFATTKIHSRRGAP